MEASALTPSGSDLAAVLVVALVVAPQLRQRAAPSAAAARAQHSEHMLHLQKALPPSLMLVADEQAHAQHRKTHAAPCSAGPRENSTFAPKGAAPVI